MADLSRAEAHVMDLNTVGLWLTNAKHQPTSSVEIEGTAATREASVTEFFTSVATSAAFQVGSNFAGDIWNFDVASQAALEQQYGVDSLIAKSGAALLSTKEYVQDVMGPIKDSVSSGWSSVTSTFEAGYNAAKSAFVNPLSGKYTQWISDVAGYAADYTAKASSFAALSPQQVALSAASTYSGSTTLPTLNNVKDHSNNLVTGNFTVEDAAKRSSTPTVALFAASGESNPVSNDILRALGYDEQPTFDQMVGILSKDHLHDNLEAALADELEKRNLDLNDLDNFNAWQESYANLQDCIEALKTEVTDNVYYITVSIGQENALRTLQRVQSARAGITDPAILATYDKCLTSTAKSGSDAVSFFIESSQTS